MIFFFFLISLFLCDVINLLMNINEAHEKKMSNAVVFQTTILHISGTNKDNLMLFSISRFILQLILFEVWVKYLHNWPLKCYLFFFFTHHAKSLTFNTLRANSADDKSMIVFLFFPKGTGFGIAGDNLQFLFSGYNKIFFNVCWKFYPPC